MKSLKLIIASAFVCMTLGWGGMVHAAPQQSAQFCGTLQSMAEKTMKNRQAGVSESRQLQSAQSSDHPQYWQKALTSLIKKAYQQPRYDTNQKRQQAVDKYGSAVRQTCDQQSAG